jgi:hypothetical protein
MESIKINKEALAIFKEIHSIKKPKEINPLLNKAVKIIEEQLFSLEIRLTQLKEENKRLGRL